MSEEMSKEIIKNNSDFYLFSEICKICIVRNNKKWQLIHVGNKFHVFEVVETSKMVDDLKYLEKNKDYYKKFKEDLAEYVTVILIPGNKDIIPLVREV